MIVQYIPLGAMRARYWIEQVPLYINSIEEGVKDSKIDYKIDTENSPDCVSSPQTISTRHHIQPPIDHLLLSASHSTHDKDEPIIVQNYLLENFEPVNSTAKHSSDVNTSKYCIIL